MLARPTTTFPPDNIDQTRRWIHIPPLQLRRADRGSGSRSCRNGIPPYPAVKGKDLMVALDMAPGPSVGRLFAARLADPELNTADALIAAARGLALAR
jgi:hypothetical protein